MKFQFNTGRPYGPKGQRIVVETTLSGFRFNDVDRGIAGYIACNQSELSSESRIKEILMFCYDCGNYVYDLGAYDNPLTLEGEEE